MLLGLNGDKEMTTPPKTNSAESETVTEEVRMKPWNKPTIRYLGQTVYTGTGVKTHGDHPGEFFYYRDSVS